MLAHRARGPGETLRVRTARHYFAPFVADLGQRNASFTKRPIAPLRRLAEAAETFCVLEPGYDLIHSINAIPILTRTPFIVTFEDFLPRLPEDRHIAWLERVLTRRLLSRRCIALVAMSGYAQRQFVWQHGKGPHLRPLEAKLHTIRPAVAPRRATPKRASDDGLRVLFVGKDFMRKGGPALVRAHARLERRGVPIRTTIVSALEWRPDDYVGPPEQTIYDGALQELARSSITLHRGLPNAEVVRLMMEADYLVLPTLHDTFGFVGLEALACGTPVIATDTCAQPEIVEPGECGYLLPFDNDDRLGKWRWLYTNAASEYGERYVTTIERLAVELERVLLHCWESRSDYERLSEGALRQVSRRFSVETARRRLEALYEEARPAHGIRASGMPASETGR